MWWSKPRREFGAYPPRAPSPSAHHDRCLTRRSPARPGTRRGRSCQRGRDRKHDSASLLDELQPFRPARDRQSWRCPPSLATLLPRRGVLDHEILSLLAAPSPVHGLPAAAVVFTGRAVHRRVKSSRTFARARGLDCAAVQLGQRLASASPMPAPPRVPRSLGGNCRDSSMSVSRFLTRSTRAHRLFPSRVSGRTRPPRA